MAIYLTDVSIAIDGHLINFEMYNNYVEYETESPRLTSNPVDIAACMKALQRHAGSLLPSKRPSVDLAILISDDEKAFWEKSLYGVFVTIKRSHYDFEFSLNTAVGMLPEEISDLVTSYIQGTNFSLFEVRQSGLELPAIEADGWRGWTVNLRMSRKDQATFSQLLAIRSRISQEVFLPRSRLSSPYLILRAIQSGRAEALLGQSESEHLEVKSSAYDLKNVTEASWKLELAQDVAQFANTANGGILIIGYRTKARGGVDVVERISAVQHKPARLQIYRDVLKARIHPPINGLQVGSVSLRDNSDLVYIYVPAQAEENQPYIVSGAHIDCCYYPSGITIVRRYGDTCVAITAQEIHAALVVGRAFIRSRPRQGDA